MLLTRFASKQQRRLHGAHELCQGSAVATRSAIPRPLGNGAPGHGHCMQAFPAPSMKVLLQCPTLPIHGPRALIPAMPTVFPTTSLRTTVYKDCKLTNPKPWRQECCTHHTLNASLDLPERFQASADNVYQLRKLLQTATHLHTSFGTKVR